MAGATWNWCLLAQALCAPYSHTLVCIVTLFEAAYVCLAVTCHLHFWQNDQDLLRAAAVTQGCNSYQNKSQHRKFTWEKKIIPALLPGHEPETFLSKVLSLCLWAVPASRYWFPALGRLWQVSEAAAHRALAVDRGGLCAGGGGAAHHAQDHPPPWRLLPRLPPHAHRALRGLASGVQRLGKVPLPLCAQRVGWWGSWTHLGCYFTQSFLPRLSLSAHRALRGLASGVQCLGNRPSAFVCQVEGWGVRGQSNTPRTLFYTKLPATAALSC